MDTEGGIETGFTFYLWSCGSSYSSENEEESCLISRLARLRNHALHWSGSDKSTRINEN